LTFYLFLFFRFLDFEVFFDLPKMRRAIPVIPQKVNFNLFIFFLFVLKKTKIVFIILGF